MQLLFVGEWISTSLCKNRWGLLQWWIFSVTTAEIGEATERLSSLVVVLVVPVLFFFAFYFDKTGFLRACLPLSHC